MTPFEKSVRFWLIVCVVLLGLIAGKIYYPAEKINSPYEEYRYNIDKALEKRHKIELEQARQYKQYNDNLVRAHTEVVKDLKDEIKELDSQWDEARKDIKEKNEKITNMGETNAKLNENVRDLRVKAHHTYKEGTGDYNEHEFRKIMYRHKDKDGNITEVPIAWSKYFRNRELGNRWKTGVYPLEYHSRIVQSEQEDGQLNTYTEVYPPEIDQVLPLISNTFIGPFVEFSTEGETMFGIGTNVPF